MYIVQRARPVCKFYHDGWLADDRSILFLTSKDKSRHLAGTRTDKYLFAFLAYSCLFIVLFFTWLCQLATYFFTDDNQTMSILVFARARTLSYWNRFTSLWLSGYLSVHMYVGSMVASVFLFIIDCPPYEVGSCNNHFEPWYLHFTVIISSLRQAIYINTPTGGNGITIAHVKLFSWLNFSPSAV